MIIFFTELKKMAKFNTVLKIVYLRLTLVISGEVWKGGGFISLMSHLLFPFISTSSYVIILLLKISSPPPTPTVLLLFLFMESIFSGSGVCDSLVRFGTAVSCTCSCNKIHLFQIEVRIFAASISETLPLPAFLLEKV